MLEEKDIQAIAKLLEESEGRTAKRMEETGSLLLDEIGRTQTYLEKQIAEVRRNVEELNQYYRITKLENENTSLLLKMIDSLREDVEALKKKTA